jgi:hypothetical protein
MDHTTEENQNTIEIKPVGDKEILLAEFEEPEISLKPYYFFCMMYCFNAIFILPFFIGLMVFKLIRDTLIRLRHCEILMVIQILSEGHPNHHLLHHRYLHGCLCSGHVPPGLHAHASSLPCELPVLGHINIDLPPELPAALEFHDDPQRRHKV